MIGTRLGPYILRAELGLGGMGRVYLAEVAASGGAAREAGQGASPPGSQVAIKIFHPHLVGASGFDDRCRREAEFGRTVLHPNVVRTLDVGAVPGTDPPVPFIVMEYAAGQTLRGLLAEMERVPEELCLHIAREVTLALAAIHGAGIVHRDLKPENVLITSEHAIKVMDLGLARFTAAAIRLSESGAFIGSFLYAAPEQFAGDGRDIDGRTDLFALGVILYELATGRNPFAGEDFRAVVDHILNLVPEPVGRRNPQLSAFFEEIVRTLLEKERGRRFASAADLLHVLSGGERTTWWRERTQAIRLATFRPPRRVRVPRETDLYGRAAEIAKLGSLYARAADGQGQVVLVSGEAGIGKTRLIDEFVAALRARGDDPHFLFGGFPPGGAATGAGAFTTAFHEHFGDEGLEAALTQHLTVTPLLVPAFTALLRGDAMPPGAEPLTRESLPTAFVHVARSLGAERPTIILIDDLHFAPAEGRALFTSLALAVAGSRVLLIGTLRPGLAPDWLAEIQRLEQASHLPVPRLGPGEITALLADAFDSPELAAEIAPAIATKSDGNPFFVFEILRELREERTIARTEDGRWQRMRALREIHIPSSVLDLIQARMANLKTEDREFLEAAACAGFEFDPGLVAAALGLELIPTLRRCAEIERQERLVRAAGRRYVFDHHQVQEVLYAELFAALRERYHAALGDALEKRDRVAVGAPEELDGALAVALCEHFLKGAAGERAVRYLDRALDHLAATYQNAAAVELAERALAAPGILAVRARLDVLLRKATRLDFAGRRDEERQALEAALGLAEEIGEPGLRARVLTSLGWHHAQAGRFPAARDLLALAVAVAPLAGDPHEEATIVRRYGDVLDAMGLHDEAIAELARAREIAVRSGDRSGEAKATGDLGVAHKSLGHLEEARRMQERCLALCQELGDRMGEAAAAGNLGVVLGELGHPDGARLIERQLAICRELGYQRGEAIATGNLGTHYFENGRFEEARRHYERHLALSREIGFRQGEAIATGNLGVLFYQRGRFAAAADWHGRHLALCRELGYRRGEAIAHGNLGDVLLEQGDTAAARAHHEESLAAARAVAARNVECFALQALARDAVEEGDATAAERLLRAALAMRRELGYRVGVAASLVALGEWLALNGRVAEAQATLAEALAIAHEIEAPDEELLAAAMLATLPGGDVTRAQALFAARSDSLGERIKMQVRFLLWQSTGDRSHLAAAHRILVALRAGTAPANRATMMAKVPLHRAIVAAWAGPPAAPSDDAPAG